MLPVRTLGVKAELCVLLAFLMICEWLPRQLAMGKGEPNNRRWRCGGTPTTTGRWWCCCVPAPCWRCYPPPHSPYQPSYFLTNALTISGIRTTKFLQEELK